MRPRAALATAGDREHAGRSGTDLLAAILVLIVATRLRTLVQAGWAGGVLGGKYAVQLVVQLLTDTLTIPLGILVIAAAAIWAASGPRRELGRAFDLACVAVMPLVFVDLIAGVVLHALDIAVPMPLMWALTALAYGWTGSLVALAMLEARRPMPPALRGAASAGWALVAIAAIGVATQGVWIARNTDQLRPMTAGGTAPSLALHTILAKGELGPTRALAPGKITVIDFWATWCNPCVKSMPHLAAFAKQHPDVDVLAVSMDEDTADARSFFDEGHYEMTLLHDDHDTSARYGVTQIPHTVVIDRAGRVAASGGGLDLEAELRRLQ
ncbi:MAG: TlpA family protein disulfide reductase [Deltaproteobacteria bacterium]|nr:TlpA family protein disulfide reductase [Deltaproteobacteria bacterium]